MKMIDAEIIKKAKEEHGCAYDLVLGLQYGCSPKDVHIFSRYAEEGEKMRNWLGHDIVDQLDTDNGGVTYFLKKDFEEKISKELSQECLLDVLQAQLLEKAIRDVSRNEAFDFMYSSFNNYCESHRIRALFQEKELKPDSEAAEIWNRKVDEWAKEIKGE